MNFVLKNYLISVHIHFAKNMNEIGFHNNVKHAVIYSIYNDLRKLYMLSKTKN
jgi:hypothetical protein